MIPSTSSHPWLTVQWRNADAAVEDRIQGPCASEIDIVSFYTILAWQSNDSMQVQQFKTDPLMDQGPMRVRTGKAFLDGFHEASTGAAGLTLPILVVASKSDKVIILWMIFIMHHETPQAGRIHLKTIYVDCLLAVLAWAFSRTRKQLVVFASVRKVQEFDLMQTCQEPLMKSSAWCQRLDSCTLHAASMKWLLHAVTDLHVCEQFQVKLLWLWKS